MKSLISLLILLTPLVSFGAVGNWQTFTNSSEIHNFTIADSILWSATNGGILRVNTITGDYEKYTNTEGLAQINVVTVAHDPNDRIWVAMPDGLLQILDVASGEWDIYNEFQNELTVYTITPQSEFVLVGFDEGIAELKLDSKNRWERTWKAELGPVNTILVTDEHIWIGQEDGVRRIAIDFPNKQIPSAWERYTVNNGLPVNQINTLVEFEDAVVAGTASGVAYFDGVQWSSELWGQDVKSLCLWMGQLAMASTAGVEVRGSSGTWFKLDGAGENSAHVRASIDNALWLGTTDDGLHWWENNAWNPLELNCPSSNIFSDLLVDRDGHLWATSTKKQTGGVYYFDGATWTNFTRKTGLPAYDYRAIEEDVFGRIWAGSWGSGVTLFEKVSDDSIKVTNLYDMDGNLSSVAGAPGYVVVTDLKSDAQGNIWILTVDAGNKQVLHAYDMDSG